MTTINPSNIKALAIDLDGTTLMPNAVLGDRTRDCIQKLISKGMQIIISTGRAIEASEKYRSALGAEGPMVYFNGAEVADMPSGKVLHTDMIDLAVVDYTTDIARELGVHYQVYMQAGLSPETGKPDHNQKWGALCIENYGEEAKMYYEHTGIKPIVTDLKKIVNLPIEGVIKGMYIADPSVHDTIRKKIFDRFGDNIQVMRSYPTFLEIINKSVSKGEGLKIAMQARGLKPQEVIAFGDEENDVSMFAVVSHSGAPENAREPIKKAANFVYGSNEKEGLAAFLESLFL